MGFKHLSDPLFCFNSYQNREVFSNRWNKIIGFSLILLLRLPDEKLKLIRAIAGYENIPLSKIFEEMVDEYIERHRESLELLRIPGFLKESEEGLKEIQAGAGKSIDELDS